MKTNRVGQVIEHCDSDGKPDTSVARAILYQARKEREESCKAEIDEALRKYNCSLEVATLLKLNQVLPQISVTARD